MTKAKAAALGPSGPLVWSEGELVPDVPDLADELACSSLNPAAFADWLRTPLARYRAHARARASMAERSTVIRWLEAAATEPAAAIADGRLRRLPAWYAEPAVVAAASKETGRYWPEVLAAGSPGVIAQVLRGAAAALRRQKSSRGRPSMRARDELLRAVIAELQRSGAAARAAEDAAEQILILCGVPVPEASIARAARRGRRGGISV